MSRGAGCRCGLDLALLWLWCGPAAMASIRPLAWEFPQAMGAALKRQKKKKEKIPRLIQNRLSQQFFMSSLFNTE